jgi:hypothetical protein
MNCYLMMVSNKKNNNSSCVSPALLVGTSIIFAKETTVTTWITMRFKINMQARP